MKSSKPRKQRKARYDAKLHQRKKWVRVHVARVLRKTAKGRNIGVRTGDTVKVLRGDKKKTQGKVKRVDVRKGRVFVEGVFVKTGDGKEKLLPLQPSNLLIVEMAERGKMEKTAKKSAAEKKALVETPKAKHVANAPVEKSVAQVMEK